MRLASPALSQAVLRNRSLSAASLSFEQTPLLSPNTPVPGSTLDLNGQTAEHYIAKLLPEDCRTHNMTTQNRAELLRLLSLEPCKDRNQREELLIKLYKDYAFEPERHSEFTIPISNLVADLGGIFNSQRGQDFSYLAARWHDYSDDQKKKKLQELYKKIRESFSLPSTTVCFTLKEFVDGILPHVTDNEQKEAYNLYKDVYGAYNHKTKVIYFNLEKLDSLRDGLETVFHESWHQYQFKRVDGFLKDKKIDKGAKDHDRLMLWANSLNNSRILGRDKKQNLLNPQENEAYKAEAYFMSLFNKSLGT